MMMAITLLYFKFYAFFGSADFIQMNHPPIIRRLSVDPSLGVFQQIKEFIFIKVPDALFYVWNSTSNLLLGLLFYLPLLILFIKELTENSRYILFIVFFLNFGLIGLILKDGDFDNFQLFTSVLILIPILLQKMILDKIIQRKTIRTFSVLTFFVLIIAFSLFPVVYFKNINKSTNESFKKVVSLLPKKKVFKIAYLVDLNKIDSNKLLLLKSQLMNQNPVLKLKQYYGGNIISLPIVNDSTSKYYENIGVITLKDRSKFLKLMDAIILPANVCFEALFHTNNFIKVKKKIFNGSIIIYLIN